MPGICPANLAMKKSRARQKKRCNFNADGLFHLHGNFSETLQRYRLVAIALGIPLAIARDSASESFVVAISPTGRTTSVVAAGY
jgi:hypothetical protein